MTSLDARTMASGCDADPGCAHAPCFQVRLEASNPRQAPRQSYACAYHVADVIQAQRAWAAQHGLADGQLIILAVEVADGGRRSGEAGAPEDPAGVPAGPGGVTASGRPDMRAFAFSTIPLSSDHLRGTGASTISSNT